MATGFVYLVGAGPGDPGLITVKGLECIKKADVLIYDRLANPRLINMAKKDAELIFAGKSPEKHTLRQNEINNLIVEKAKQGKIVTRLKGGDPFVFGRGGEEAEALLAEGLDYEVVPGITSGIAAPAYAGIPVTHRDFTSTLGIITGNEDPTKEDTSIDWSKISKGMGTLVFYMGMKNLPHIVDKLISNGRNPKTPIALIRWGTRPEQKTVTGTLEDIIEKAQLAHLTHPVIIVVGEVVSLREKLHWFEKKPLFGQRVLITRARSQASVFAKKIEDLGGEPWEFPAIEITDPNDYGPLDKGIIEINNFDYLIFTSVNGVQYFFNRLRYHHKDIRELKGIKIVAIGPKTREEVEKYGIFCDFMPDEFVAEAIVEIFAKEDIRGKKFFLPRADIARKVLPKTLREMGAEVIEADAYKTVKGSGNLAQLKEMLASKRIQMATFTSSSTVRNFIQQFDASERPELMKNVIVACIGPITANTARELGLQVDIEAEVYTIDGLVEAILDYLSKNKKTNII